jgi:uncharacterized membrane protein YfcA
MAQLFAETAPKEFVDILFLKGFLAVLALVFAGYGVSLLYDFFLLLFQFTRTRSTPTQIVAALVTASMTGFLIAISTHVWQSPRWGPEFVGMTVLTIPGVLGYVVFIAQLNRRLLRRPPK